MQVEVNKIATLKGHSGPVYCIDKGTKASTFFTGSGDKYAALWNMETLQAEKFAAILPAAVYCICYIPEKNLLLAGTTEGKVHLLDLVKKEEIKILQHHTAAVFDIKYSLTTNCFYTTGGDGCMAKCSLETLSLIQLKKMCEEKIRSIDFNTVTNEIAIAASDCNIRILDLSSLEQKHIFEAHSLAANVVRYSPDGSKLLTGGRDAHLNIRATSDYSLLKSIPAHNFAIYDIAYSPDLSLIATASRDKTIKLWDANSFEFVMRISKENFDGHTHSVNRLLWSSYTNYLISVSDDRTIMIWDIQH